jgi:hypothetical protein
MDWISVAQDSDKLNVLVNRAMNLRVQKIVGKFLSN